MGPSGGEGLEPERRDPQESSYRRPQEQQQPHHIPASAPGEWESCGEEVRGKPRVHTHPRSCPYPGHEQQGQGGAGPRCDGEDAAGTCQQHVCRQTEALEKWGLRSLWGWKYMIWSHGGREGARGGSGFGRPGPELVSRWLPVYQQPQQQPAAQSYGGYKEPAAPVSIQRSAPGGGGVSGPGGGRCGRGGEPREGFLDVPLEKTLLGHLFFVLFCCVGQPLEKKAGTILRKIK